MEAGGGGANGEMNGNGHGAPKATNGSATMRKASDMNGGLKDETPTKKIKSDQDEDEDDEDQDDDG